MKRMMQERKIRTVDMLECTIQGLDASACWSPESSGGTGGDQKDGLDPGRAGGQPGPSHRRGSLPRPTALALADIRQLAFGPRHIPTDRIPTFAWEDAPRLPLLPLAYPV